MHDACMNEQTKPAALKNARVQTAVHRSKGQEKVLTQLALPACSSAQSRWSAAASRLHPRLS